MPPEYAFLMARGPESIERDLERRRAAHAASSYR
jgi:hypothetical protein